MKLDKDIYFNSDKLINKTKIKISYMRALTESETVQKITCHYGYGPSWDNIGDIELFKTDTGYQNEITIEGENCFNFCFFDDSGNWDNNNGANYSFPIDKDEEKATEFNNIIDQNVEKNLSLITLETSYFGKVKLMFNKIFKSIPSLFKRVVKADN